MEHMVLYNWDLNLKENEFYDAFMFYTIYV